MNECRPVIPCIWSKVTILQRLLSAYYADAFRALGLTNEQASLLFMISSGTIGSQKALGALTGLEKSTISRNLAHLVEKGLVHLPQAKNTTPFRLTARGRALMHKMAPAWAAKQAGAGQIFDTRTLGALDTAIHALIKISK